MNTSETPHGHRPGYVGLVAALRAEFNPMQLEALWIQMREHRYGTSSLGTLAQAVHDAHDVAYDAGELVHPAVKAWLDRKAAEAVTARSEAPTVVEHVTTVEQTFGGPLGPNVETKRWSCSCGAKGNFDYLMPPTAERLAGEHREQASGASRG